MLVQVQGYPQVDFLLQVRKAGLALISTKELDTLMKDMVMVQIVITEKGYGVKLDTMFRGVMT